MTEFVELGEEIGGDLQRVEVEEEVESLEDFVRVAGGGGGLVGGAAVPQGF